MLRRFDEDPKFGHFLDLAPELRIEIYKGVLTHDDEFDSVAYPEILRVSKLVHQEASDVLYGESRLVIWGRLDTQEEHGRRFLSGFVKQYTNLKPEVIRFPQSLPPSLALVDWMDRIRLIRHLHFRFTFWNYTDGPYRYSLAKILLANVVAHCKDLRSMTVLLWHRCVWRGMPDSHDPDKYDEAKMVGVLRPLKGLAEGCTLHLVGLDEDIEQLVREEIGRHL